MTILPIVERELRVASRRPFTMRVLVAGVAMIVGVFVFLSNLGASQAALGKYIFTGIAVVAMLDCLFAGRAFTADCLSEEKREGTLGLLFLTDLKGYDVVLGKLAATSLNGFYNLLAVLPVLAMPLLLGGVSRGQFWRVALILMDTFLFSLAIGMFSSATCREARRAMGMNFAVLFLFVLLLPGSAVLMAVHSASHTFYGQFIYACPPYTLFFELAPIKSRPWPGYFWQSLAVIHALTWLMLFLSALIVRRSWQDRPAPPKRTRRAMLRELWQRWNYGLPGKRATFRKRLLDVNAFYWLAARAKLKPLHVWTAYAFLGVWWISGRIMTGTDWLDEGVNFTAILMINVLLKL